MKNLYQLIENNEEWLIDRVLDYAIKHNYVKYTSTLREAWRKSIVDLSERILAMLQNYDSVPELNQDTDYSQDIIASYGILQAQRHRERGVDTGMFLGLFKYYRRSYIDLVLTAEFERDCENHYRLQIEKFFDRIEVGLCTKQVEVNKSKVIRELQASNRSMTNEKNKYLTIYESLPIPVILFNEKNYIDTMNHAATGIFQDYNNPVVSYYGAKDTMQSLPWLVDELTEFTKNKEPEFNFVKKLETKQGSLYFRIKLKQMLDVSEKFAGTVVMLTDITSRKKTVDKIKYFNTELNQIFNTSAGGMRVIDKDFNVLRINNTFAKMTGQKPEETVGKKCYKSFSGTFCHTPNCPVNRIINGEEKVEHDVEKERYDGVKIPCIVTATPFLAPDGELLGIVEDIRDISERKQAQAILERYQLLSEHARDIILFVNYDGRIIEANNTAVKAYGYTREELLNKKIFDLRANNIEFLIEEQMGQAKSKGILFETTHRSKDGRTFPVEVSSKGMKVNSGYILLSIIRDISVRKKMEEQLKYMSWHDSLTGLYNRAYFEQEMQCLEKGHCDPVGVIVCDVDGLKPVNDTLGHDAGDELLMAAASVIKKAFRKDDMVARIGGDEFVVLLPNSDHVAVQNSSDRIKDAITNYNADNPKPLLSISVGFAIKSGTDTSLNDTFKQADNNMYREKRSNCKSAR